MKKQEHILNQLPDYLLGAVSATEKTKIETHVKSCASCRREFTTMNRMWSELGLLPAEHPTAKMRTQFYAELNRRKAELERRHAPEHRFLDRLNALIERLWPKQPAVQFAMALMFMLVGYVVGFRIDGGPGLNGNGELAELRTEMQTMQRMVAMTLLKTQSASERIKGVNWTERINQPDTEVLAALFQTLNYDQNVNVRLAALEALTRFYDRDEVRGGLIESLPKQSSPLIQLAMLDVFVEARDTEAVPTFKTLLQKESLNETVRERVTLRLTELEGR
jgi:hypothetical protein